MEDKIKALELAVKKNETTKKKYLEARPKYRDGKISQSEYSESRFAALDARKAAEEIMLDILNADFYAEISKKLLKRYIMADVKVVEF
jgi:hypothetical protein